MTDSAIRIGLVEDHDVIGFALQHLVDQNPGWSLVAVERSVGDLDLTPGVITLVLLDLRLDDGSTPADNIEALRVAGIPTLAFTAGEDPELLRQAARAGILGIVRKSDHLDVLIDAIPRVARGEAVATAEWASAIDADASLPDAGLSPREREILLHYASGETAQGVAELTGLSKDTVANYVGRIRTKYARVGRPATTKVDLHIRAKEDGLIQADTGLRKR